MKCKEWCTNRGCLYFEHQKDNCCEKYDDITECEEFIDTESKEEIIMYE